MPYTKTDWENGVTPPINATNLNKIENQLEQNTNDIENAIVCTPLEPTDAKIWLQFQDNLYDKSTITTGYYLDKTTGEPTSNSSYAYSDYIDISNVEYLLVYANMFPTSPSSPGIIFYDENKEFISGIVVKSSTGYISSLPTGTKYMRYSILWEQINTLKIIEGNPLIESTNELLEDKIFIKNKIGKYQEFFRNNYSTTALPIGVWLDGRTIWRKTINFSTFQTTYNMNIVGAKDIVNVDVIVHRKDYDNMYHKLPCRLDDANVKMDLQYVERTSNNVILHLSWGSHYTDTKINNVVAVVEYTLKTE